MHMLHLQLFIPKQRTTTPYYSSPTYSFLLLFSRLIILLSHVRPLASPTTTATTSHPHSSSSLHRNSKPQSLAVTPHQLLKTVSRQPQVSDLTSCLSSLRPQFHPPCGKCDCIFTTLYQKQLSEMSFHVHVHVHLHRQLNTFNTRRSRHYPTYPQHSLPTKLPTITFSSTKLESSPQHTVILPRLDKVLRNCSGS